MKKIRKSTFAGSFTTIALVMILLVKLILALIFFNFLRGIVTRQTEINTKENVAHSRELIISNLREHEVVLSNAAVGLTHFYRQMSAASVGVISAPRETLLDVQAVKSYLHDMMINVSNSLDIYFSNNITWNLPGGFAAFGSGWSPDNDWDNTKRPWFIAAKNAQGEIAFSQPYVDSDTDNIIITLSMIVFNGTEDIGVIASDVTVNDLGKIVNSKRNYQNQEIYIINREGLFITHDDINAVLKKDLFAEKKLEKHRLQILLSEDLYLIDNNHFIYSSVIPHTDWILVSIIPASVIFAETNAFILYLVLFCIFMFACVTTVSIVFAHRKITIPLSKVLNMTNSLADKEFNISPESFGNDEIGEIQHALMKIRDKLKSGIDSLYSHMG